MQNLQITNTRFITYRDDVLIIDVLGGVDLSQVERMVCTLRISYQQYPSYRTTLDLYHEGQSDKLLRSLCEKWELKLIDVSRCLHQLTLQLEEYRLQELRFLGKARTPAFELGQEDKKAATTFLKNKNLSDALTQTLNATGIIGEDENALILFLALASHKFATPFSVVCLAKSGIDKSYMLQKLRECMPEGSYSYHTRISENALYYFDSHHLQGKALLVEDLDWTSQMLQPLAALQTQGRLVNTRATKNRDGMLHATTFEVVAHLCLVAFAHSDKTLTEASLPFLCLNLNHSPQRDKAVMTYEKKCRAGQIRPEAIQQAQHLLKCAVAALQPVSVVNPFATLINLPDEVAYPRKALLLLLNFIEAITFFFQYQREQIVEESTGEIFVKTHPQDIELAYRLLKDNLFHRVDEVSVSARVFYNWLSQFLVAAQTQEFTALDVRRAKPMHPRTLNRYLQELKLYGHVQVIGGNKHREGFTYRLTGLASQTDTQSRIEQDIQTTLKDVWAEYHSQQPASTKSKASKTVRQKQVSNFQSQQP